MAKSKAKSKDSAPAEPKQIKVEKPKAVRLKAIRNALNNAVSGVCYQTHVATPVDPALLEEGCNSWELKQLTAGLLEKV